MKQQVVLFHANCNDGFGAAWAAFQVFGNKAVYRPMQYGDPTPDDLDDRDVYILDFSFPRDELLDLHSRSRSLLVLDHHATAQAELEGLKFAQFDMEQSAATMTWKHFFPDEECPWLLRYIEDRDLWRWELEHSEEVHAGLQSHPRNFQLWTKLINQGADAMIREGRPVVRFKRRLIDAASSRIRMVELDGHRIPKVNSCLLQSEIGSRLARKHPFVAIVFEVEGRKVWSLRSQAPDGIDVGAIARRHGGGGHRHAAGFIERLPSLPPVRSAGRGEAEAGAEGRRPERERERGNGNGNGNKNGNRSR